MFTVLTRDGSELLIIFVIMLVRIRVTQHLLMVYDACAIIFSELNLEKIIFGESEYYWGLYVGKRLFDASFFEPSSSFRILLSARAEDNAALDACIAEAGSAEAAIFFEIVNLEILIYLTQMEQ